MNTRKWHEHFGKILDSKDGYDVIDCVTCGFKHIIPIPTDEELSKIYTNDYYKHVDNFFDDRFQEDKDWYDLVYADRYDTFEQLLPKGKRSLLDIGCGGGYFLKYGKDRKWHTLGVEPSTQAYKHLKDLGLDVINDFFCNDIAKKFENQFDVVYLNEVLEHIPNPTLTLSLIKKVLSPDGLVCIVVPNDYNPFQQSLVKVCNFKPWWVAPPYHINYFDFLSLENLLKKVGFKVILKETSFPIDMFLLMGDNYVGNDPLGRICHTKRKLFEKNLSFAGFNELKRNLYRALASLNIGREVIIYARK